MALVFDSDEQPIPLTLQTHHNRWFAIGEGIVDQIGDSAPKGYRLHTRLKFLQLQFHRLLVIASQDLPQESMQR